MNIVLKPAGLILVMGSVVILVVMMVVNGQKSSLKELPQINAPIAGFQSTKREAKGKSSAFDGKDALEPVNLSEVGTVDWVHWGLSGPQAVNRKADSSSDHGHIGTYTLSAGNNGLLKAGQRGPSRGIFWKGGTPKNAVPVTYTGVNIAAKNGFQFAVKADPRPHTLRVYVGGYRAAGQFSAWLPDGSPARVAVKDTALESGYYSRVYTVDFHPTSPNQELKVIWRTDGVGGDGNLSLQAAALE